MTRIAFLILDDIHHVHHLAPVAFELSRRSEYQCVIFIQQHSQNLVEKIAQSYPHHRCEISLLSASLLKRLKYRLCRQSIRSERIIHRHIRQLLDFDAFVSPDRDVHELRAESAENGKNSVFFSIRHGAGDRNNVAESENSKLDFMLLPGIKYQQRFAQAGYLTEDNHAVIGYPKFDLIPENARPRLFPEDKPVIVYNPHFLPEMSSWSRWGMEILEYFYSQKNYYFIFAPHRNLFCRMLKPKTLPRKYFKAAHMLMDLNSEKLVDMTYLHAADIYLGDVSSQVYEFVRCPRPCLFLNAHNVAWRDNIYYRNWEMGMVIERLPDLWAHLAIQPFPNPYVDIQKKLFNETYSVTAEPSAKRAADAIHTRLQRSVILR